MLPKEKTITTKEQLKDWLKADTDRYICGRIARIFCVSETAILRKHQILLRKTEYHTNINHPLQKTWYKFRLIKLQNKYALHIPVNCCGKGLHIVHLGPILINNNAQLGENCSLHINTAVVAGGVTDKAPIIGNNVVFGIGSVALGDIHIADYTAIGANAVVNKDVLEENIAVAGVPAKKVSNNGSKEWNK
ncbi:MAG: hypothetical protein KBS41_04945 [Oscillospiraceae bacterium]|nr:hypothetical protein [Candidatus Equicaccousia limihippi]